MATSDATNKFYCLLPMSKVFQVWPKRIKRSNGTVLTPDMEVTVTTLQHTTTPFYNGAKELQEVYMRIYASTTRRHVAIQVILNLENWISFNLIIMQLWEN